jgi:hypothetical protein
MDDLITYTAFRGGQLLASGALESMLRSVKPHVDSGAGILIFQDQTGRQVDFDFRGSVEEVVARAAGTPTRTGPGRPKLGVVSREISLLPRHWEWLEAQPSGASAALRRLVDEARKRDGAEWQQRQTVDAVGRVMMVLAGNMAGFEEAYRALYARDFARLAEESRYWPDDVRRYLLNRLSQTTDN